MIKLNLLLKKTHPLLLTMKRVARALLVGIDYEGTNNVLRGCSQDVMNMRDLIKNKYRVSLLCDDLRAKDSIALPTMDNVLSQLVLLRNDLNRNENKQFLFHYSGHGTYTWDTSGDEKDGQDELIYCLDGPISDDMLNDVFFSKLESNIKGLVLMDCCFSGTICDLRFTNDTLKTTVENSKDTTTADVLMISGCTDSQTSADALIAGTYQGAMTSAFLTTVGKFGTGIPNSTFLRNIRNYLRENKYSQKPLMSFTNENTLVRELNHYIN